MDKPLLFSVIIPTYNRSHLLAATIDSVLNQRYPHLEIIVVDDGSTDQTQEVVATFKDPRIRYHYKINEERGKARNTGIDLALGQYVTFLDSDDLVYQDHLEVAARFLNEHNQPPFYRQGYEIRTAQGNLIGKKNNVTGNANEFILKGNYFSCIGVFLKREIAASVQFSNDRYMSLSEDWEYWLRLSVRYPISYNNAITACMVHHAGRSTGSFHERNNKLAISRFLKGLSGDAVFMEKKGGCLNKIKAQLYTLYCLHKVLSGKNTRVLSHLLYAIYLSPSELFRRRFLAIVKYYTFNLFR